MGAAEDTNLILPGAELKKPADVHRGDLLPNCVAREIKNVVFKNGVPYVPIFCANCGCDGGWVVEETKDFAFYLCNPCADTWSPMAGTMLVPDEVFWERSKQIQLEKYGRELLEHELVEILKDDSHILTKLTKDRYDWKRLP